MARAYVRIIKAEPEDSANSGLKNIKERTMMWIIDKGYQMYFRQKRGDNKKWRNDKETVRS